MDIKHSPTRADYALMNYASSSLRYSESFEEPAPGAQDRYTPSYPSREKTEQLARESCPRWDLL